MIIRKFQKRFLAICILCSIIFSVVFLHSCYTIPDTIYICRGDQLDFDNYGLMSRFFAVDTTAGEAGELTKSGTVHGEC